MESGVVGGRLETVGVGEEDLTDGADFVDHAAWRVWGTGKVVLVGVKHDDVEAPVQLVVVVREFGEDS